MFIEVLQVQWAVVVPFLFLVVGSRGLGDASLRWMRYFCLISVWFSEPYQYLASIIEVFVVSRAIYQYIVDIYLTYGRAIDSKYFVSHTTLIERVRAFETVPFKQTILGVYSCESEWRGVWWQPAVKSIIPNTLGFRVPILLIICWMLGMVHHYPSSQLVTEFNRPRVHQLTSVSPSASFPNAYMEVATLFHLSQSSFVQLLQAPYGF